jgi:Fic family protein
MSGLFCVLTPVNDDNWELINGPIANQIEVINAANQINLLDAFILFMLAHRGPNGQGNPPMPDEASLLELHRTGTVFLLAQSGIYRNIEVTVLNSLGEIIHHPPPWQIVPGAMQHFFRELSSIWTSGDALDVAAYALWRINWVHPFRNGNGRTARAFCYACLCTKIGVVLPGRITVIDQIMSSREEYQRVLKVADDSYHATRMPDLSPMKAFLDDLLQKQIASITAQAVATSSP